MKLFIKMRSSPNFRENLYTYEYNTNFFLPFILMEIRDPHHQRVDVWLHLSLVWRGLAKYNESVFLKSWALCVTYL